jgi:hypothetical protein
MAGFGALKLALRHPDLLAFVDGISPAINVPMRPFSKKRIGQWRRQFDFPSHRQRASPVFHIPFRPILCHN